VNSPARAPQLPSSTRSLRSWRSERTSATRMARYSITRPRAMCRSASALPAAASDRSARTKAGYCDWRAMRANTLPRPTTSAPASRSARASAPVVTPPMPTMGTSGPTALRMAATLALAVSRIHSPDFPPLCPLGLYRMGWPDTGSRNTSGPTVLMATIPSAPASTAARAMPARSGTLGVSLGNSRAGVARRMACTYSRTVPATEPMAAP